MNRYLADRPVVKSDVGELGTSSEVPLALITIAMIMFLYILRIVC